MVHRCEKFVDIKGEYIEKWQSCFTLKKLVRPETFGPYHIIIIIIFSGSSAQRGLWPPPLEE
jgi:hypothetical protein